MSDSGARVVLGAQVAQPLRHRADALAPGGGAAALTAEPRVRPLAQARPWLPHTGYLACGRRARSSRVLGACSLKAERDQLLDRCPATL
ncbi:hypothetical protein [Nocardiopsis tropica]|uniref:Uncharacterized protein n=1 Tax=Nocardiopsis tropica TaxID=109330 RepID=A0ABU7KXZ4_9ACTN|nr:hypothetical protein [Nocardiopsis umidischolae]MEE2054154.1 hypothetical protein [Nocardiopsis umidischolae]